jgi:hypothetical protein
MKNERIWGWFSNGHVCDALLGRGGYFIADVTYREEHDLSLIFSQLFSWAEESGRESDAARGIESVIHKLLLEGAVREALNLAWSYLVVAEERGKNLPLDIDSLQRQLAASIQKEAHQVSIDESLRRLTLLVAEKLPALSDQLGLSNKMPRSQSPQWT